LIFRNNLIPYDRTSQSLFSQMYSTGIRGAFNNFDLPVIASTQSTWGYWKEHHPQTTVLSLHTGYSRDYTSNPYGNYPVSLRILFPVRFPNSQYHPKHLTLGIVSGEQLLAIPAEELFNQKVLNTSINEIPIVAVYESSAHMMTAFSSVIDGELLEFSPQGGLGVPVTMIDDQTNSTWTSMGVAIDGPMTGRTLTQLTYFTCYWFAWHDFYPETEIYTEN